MARDLVAEFSETFRRIPITAPGACGKSYRAAVRRALKAEAFKAWVHAYLDAQGVPHHPPGPHGAEGCRIGDRMNWLMARLRKVEAALLEVQAARNAMENTP